MLVYALPGEPGGPGSRPGGLPDGANDGTGGQPSGPGDGPGPGDGLTYGLTNSDGAAPLARVAAELLLAAEASANLVVLRTPAGAAQFLASVLDHANLPAVLGTVAGDDTVLVISRDPAGGDDLARALLALAERRGNRARRPGARDPNVILTSPTEEIMTQRVVLAYSGGLDTSVAIGWIAEQTGAEVIALAIDVGQGGEDLDDIRKRALDCGAAAAEVRRRAG